MRYVTRDAIAVDRDDASRGGVARRECARGRRVRARHSRAEPFDRALESPRMRACERAGARGGGEGGVAREGWYAGTLRAGAARVDGAGEGRRTRGGEGNARA